MSFDDYYMRRHAYVSSRQKQRRRQRRLRIVLFVSILTLLLVLIGVGILIYKIKTDKPNEKVSMDSLLEYVRFENKNGSDHEPETFEVYSDTQISPLDELLAEADRLALGYDYDRAIELLSSSDYSKEPAVLEAIASYENTKSTLVRIDPLKIPHVFFHSLIIDNKEAFDGDADEAGYNQVMTTKREFLEILDQMYERGYVLVKMHDVAYEKTDADGKTSFVTGNIMLPPGKKAFVMSQDDVCYYEYMDGDGFASRMVIGDDGKPTCEMKLADGTTSVGPYDLVPILEDFIEKHPDFSYKGARAVLAFTGYEGVLGYRTDPEYKDKNPNYEEDCDMVRRVAQCLRDNGWELASHSWGHINHHDRDFQSVKTDADKWESRVESLIGETDIILYPYGADIGDWRLYTYDNEKFTYLYDLGFRYFCNVDGSPYWVQIDDQYMRQGRRNLDGYRMYYDLPETNPEKTYLDDLIDVTTVFDKDRPTPVPPM